MPGKQVELTCKDPKCGHSFLARIEEFARGVMRIPCPKCGKAHDYRSTEFDAMSELSE
ncbi:MAG TPA: hypothetical protein VK473_12615 [Terriglobales bacterium]|nr:hypothetical protein [Terriglobales bacterium]